MINKNEYMKNICKDYCEYYKTYRCQKNLEYTNQKDGTGIYVEIIKCKNYKKYKGDK